MTKGERNKDKGKKYLKRKETYDILIYNMGERYDKEKGSTKILSTQVGGASS